jgi:hypothetical protein
MEEKPKPSYRKTRLARKRRLQRIFQTDSDEDMDYTENYPTEEVGPPESCEALE